MRILIAVHTYYPDRNGVQNVTEYLAEGLAKNGANEVLVLSQMKEGYETCEVHNEVSIIRLEAEQRDFRFFGDDVKYISTIKEYAPDVLVCVCLQSWQFDWLRPHLDELTCKKVLYTHGSSAYFDYYPIKEDILGLHLKALHYHNYWKKYYSKAFEYMAKFDRVVYLSENNSSYRYAVKNGLENGIIIPNAVSDEYFEDCVYEDPSRFSLRGKTNLLYVANYDENKNQKDVLRAYYKAETNYVTLTLMGGQNRGYFEELIKLNDELSEKSEMSKATIFYAPSHKEIMKQMKESDVFLCGSKKEQYPLMLCEAAAMGMAIISTDVGHAKELPGCVVVADYDDMAAKINELSSSPKVLKENAMKLREYAESHYRIEDKIKLFEGLLKDILG